jgi:hypothetical protein
MTETPGERLRRIVSAWRKQKPSSTATPAPVEADRATPAASPSSGKAPQPSTDAKPPTREPSSGPIQPAGRRMPTPAAQSREDQAASPSSEKPAQQTAVARPPTQPPIEEPAPLAPERSAAPAAQNLEVQAASPLSEKPAQPLASASPLTQPTSSGPARGAQEPITTPGRHLPPSVETPLLSRLTKSQSGIDGEDASPLQETRKMPPPPPPSGMPPLESAPSADELKTPAEAHRFLERLRAKTAQVVQDFSTGAINQRQFQAVYSHYQRQLIAVEKALIEMPGSGAWRAAAVEGHTSFLREQHAAQVLSYAIYETGSGIPLAHVGAFQVDEALLVPMLSTFRSSTEELFGAGMKRIELEGGQWLCYVPGRHTTLIVVYSAEPATTQLQTIEDSHRDFELVYQMNLSSGDVHQLARTFTSLWAFEQGSTDS